MKVNKSYSKIDSPREKNNLPSLTVPNQSMTVDQLRQKFGGSIDMAVTKAPIYEPNPDIHYPNPLRRMVDPLTDLQSVNEEINAVKSNTFKKPEKQQASPET